MYMYMHKQSMNHIYVCIMMHVWLYVLHCWYVVQISKPLNPGSSFRILSRSFGEKSDFSPKLRDKIRNEEPGFEATS